MANTCFWRMSQRVCTVCKTALAPRLTVSTYRRIGPGVLLSAAVTGLKEDKGPVLEAPDPSTLTSSHLIRRATSATVDAANSLVTQTAIALAQAEKEYAEAVFTLTVLMEYRLQVLGKEAEETRISDLILQARALVTETRLRKQNLELMMTSCTSVLNSAAEVAYMTGEDFSGSIAGDRLYKTELFLKQAKRESEEADTKLGETETRAVDVEAKHAEEQERKRALEQQEAEEKTVSVSEPDDKHEQEEKESQDDEAEEIIG